MRRARWGRRSHPSHEEIILRKEHNLAMRRAQWGGRAPPSYTRRAFGKEEHNLAMRRARWGGRAYPSSEKSIWESRANLATRESM
jgi:hypothetical protein